MPPEDRPSTPARTRGPQAFEVVLAWVDDEILEGRLTVGDHLPAERELAASLDVSRSAVREAVRTLQAQGVVHSFVGAGPTGGTVLMSVPSRALSRLLRLHVALANFPAPDVIEVRIALERLSVRLATRNASTEDLADARLALEVMADRSIDRQAFNDADTAFHVALATAAGNRLASDLTAAIRESMSLPILDRFRHVPRWEDVVEGLRSDHEAIFAAVERRDAQEAEALVEAHIRSAWRALTSSEETPPPT